MERNFPLFQTLAEYLEKVLKGIDEVLKALDETQKSRAKQNATVSNFNSYSSIFQVAKNLPQIPKVNISELKVALKFLADNTGPLYTEEQDALDIIHPLDLNFEKYEFSKTALSLEAMDQFFTDFAKFQKTGGTKEPESAQMTQYIEAVTVVEYNWTAVIVLSVVVMFLIGAILAILYYFSWFKKRQEKPEKKGSSEEVAKKEGSTTNTS